MKPIYRRSIKVAIATLATPIVLFVLLAVLLYVPPVQNWAVRQAASYASASTGMNVSVERVRLSFPLDLSIQRLLATQPNDSLHNRIDTIAAADELIVGVKLLPLFAGNVDVSDLDFRHVNLNTAQFVLSARVKGGVGRLKVEPSSVSLAKETVDLGPILLSDANLDIALSDTVPEDTTKTENNWQIAFTRLSVKRSAVKIHMPGDTLAIGVGLTDVGATDGDINLAAGVYKVGTFDWRSGFVTYDNNFAQRQKGLDVNHIALKDVSLRIDSLSFVQEGTKLQLALNRCAFREQSGISVTSAAGHVSLDTAHISLPDFRLTTPASWMKASADMDFTTFADTNPGVMRLNLDASVGKTDILQALGMMPLQFVLRLPEQPLNLRADINGNMQNLNIRELSVKMPTAFNIKANGKAGNLTDIDHLKANINLDARADNISFLLPMMGLDKNQAVRIPNGITLKGNCRVDGPQYATEFVATQGGGSLRGRGAFNMRSMAYRANAEAHALPLQNFLSGMGLQSFSGELAADGAGFDFLSPKTRLDARVKVANFHYDGYDLSNMKLKAEVANGVGRALLDSRTPLLNGIIDLRTLLDNRRIDANVLCNLLYADFHKLGLTEKPLTTSMTAHLDVKSDLKATHSVNGVVGNIVLRDSAAAYRPENILVDIFTRSDSTHANVACGDFALHVDGAGSVEHILNHFNAINDEADKQRKERYIDQLRLRECLPELSVYFKAGKENVLSRVARRFGYDFRDAYIDMNTSPVRGINGKLSIDSLVAAGIQLDTIRLTIGSDSTKTLFNGQICNNRYNKQYVFNALFRGAFYQQSLFFGTQVFDDRNRLGVALGLKANMEQNGVRMSLGGIDPVFGYKKFKVNKGNYVSFTDDNRISADMRLLADDGMGVKVFSNDSTEALHDLTIGLTRFDLAKVLSVIPYAPNVSGVMNGDFHYINNQNDISVSSSVRIDNLAYEGCKIGNVASEFIYMPRDGGNEHCVDGTLSVDDQEVCTLSGTYITTGFGHLTADVELQRTPLLLLDGFIPNRLLNFEGYAVGRVKIDGQLDRLNVNGELMFDSAYIASEPYGVKMRLCDDPVTITDSKMMFENFQLFARNDSPLTLYGNVDFSNMSNMTMYMRMRASNYLLIDSKEKARSEAFGKAYVNFLGLADGPFDALRIRGRLDVLGSSDITYILRDSPLTTDNQLDGLVKFVNFKNPDDVKVERPPLNGLTMDLTVNIDEGAHVLCALNAAKSNYVDIVGGGQLRMNYTDVDGLGLYGRYTIGQGEMKYSLPVIPLKTFTIKDGSYVEFMGDIMNPRLNITATEENKTTVTNEAGVGRSVTFECGVEITKTLNDMGLQFTIDAPDDQDIHNELMTQSAENRGKLAVTMLTTGMYLNDNSLGSFNMSSALSSFLSSQISAISGSALRTLDLSFGMDNTQLGSGAVHTDYSFKFSKRFLNNRLRIVIGGKVSSGAEIENQNDTFFDNVALEYRLSPKSNKYLKLFYDRATYDWLEGYVGQFGGGFIWRRKLQSLKDIFRFKSTDNLENIMQQGSNNGSLQQKKDSTSVQLKDSGNIKK